MPDMLKNAPMFKKVGLEASWRCRSLTAHLQVQVAKMGAARGAGGRGRGGRGGAGGRVRATRDVNLQRD